MSTYNGEKYIREQLNSILAQTYPNITIYVQDDGSSDNTLSILTQYEKEGKIERIYNSRKDLIYKVTKLGLKEKKNLNIKYLKDSLRVYKEAKGNVLPFSVVFN